MRLIIQFIKLSPLFVFGVSLYLSRLVDFEVFKIQEITALTSSSSHIFESELLINTNESDIREILIWRRIEIVQILIAFFFLVSAMIFWIRDRAALRLFVKHASAYIAVIIIFNLILYNVLIYVMPLRITTCSERSYEAINSIVLGRSKNLEYSTLVIRIGSETASLETTELPLQPNPRSELRLRESLNSLPK